MTPESWQRVQKILEEALVLSRDDRGSFLDSTCGDDLELRREVESLLEMDDEAGAFIEEPVLSLRPETDETRPRGACSTSPGVGREGDRIGSYRILRELGRGGMGKVLLASRADEEFEREVAIKVLQRGKDSDEIVRRFRHERQILANLAHPNIAELFDGGTTESGLPYFVLEYVEGVRIDEYCDDRRLTIRQRLELFRKVCSAVHFAHQSLVVHRDLKPGNILVTADGEPKLLDFGIAKLLPTAVSPTDTTVDQLTESGIEPMTPDYASPEQIQGEAITTASDVYSLGVLLYRLLCGHGPYRLKNRSVGRLFQAITEVEPGKPSDAVLDGTDGQISKAEEISAARRLDPRALKRRMSGDLDAIVLKALRKKPQERYGSVEQLSEDIRRHLERLPVVARQGTLFYQTSKFLRRHSVALGAAAAVLLMVFFGVRSMLLANQAEREKQVTQSLATLFQRLQELQPRDAENPGFEADLISEVRRNVDDLELATILNEQAKFLENQGGFATAEVLYREALAMVIRLFGDVADANVAIIKNNLAAAMEAQGEYGEAERLLRETLEARIAVYGRESYETTIALNNLGVLLQNKGDLDAAEPYLLESLEKRRRLFDSKAIQMGLVLNNYGFFLQARGDYQAAEAHYREALSIFRTHFGLEHPSVGTVLRNLASLMTLTGDLDNAAKLSRQALDIFNRSYFKHWRVADAESVAGGTLAALGRHDEAELLLRRSYMVLSTTKGSNARQTKEALARLESLEEAVRNGL